MDYIGITDKLLTVQSGSQQCFEIAILNDDITELPESFQIMLSYSNKSQVYYVTIEDDDGAYFERDGYIVTEGDQFVTICVIFHSETNKIYTGNLYLVDGGNARGMWQIEQL